MKSQILIIIIIMMSSVLSIARVPEEYYNIAANNNPGLKAKYNEYEAALQRIPQVNALPDPVFSFGYFISPVETRVGPQQAKFSLTQMFPWFGTLKAEGDATALMADAKFQSFIDARNKLYFKVSASYYPIYELKKWIMIEKDNIEILESYKTIASQKFENGNGTMVDVLRVDIMMKDAKTNLSILQKKQKALITAFNKILNRPEDDEVMIADSLQYEKQSENFRKDSLIAENPKIKELNLKVKAGKAGEIAAKKQGYPKFGFGLDYIMVGERSDNTIPDNGKDIFMPMVSVSIPIFRSKYKAAVKEAQILQESYTYQIEEITNKIISDYEMIWFEINQHEELIMLYEQQIQTTKQSLNLLFTSYGNSGKDFEEVLRMQQQLLKYQKLKVSALAEYHVALAEFDYVTSKVY